MSDELARLAHSPLGPLTAPQQEAAVQELHRLQREHQGELTPAVVVDAAKPIEAPLHPAFEWRDLVAAERYREIQARQIIRLVKVVHVHEPRSEAREARAFVSVDGPDESSNRFVTARGAAEDPKLAAILVESFVKDIDMLLERFSLIPKLKRILDSAKALALAPDEDVPAAGVRVVEALGLPAAPEPNIEELRAAAIAAEDRRIIREAVLRPLSTNDVYTLPKLFVMAKDHVEEMGVSMTVEALRDHLSDLVREGIVGVTTTGLERHYRARTRIVLPPAPPESAGFCETSRCGAPAEVIVTLRTGARMGKFCRRCGLREYATAGKAAAPMRLLTPADADIDLPVLKPVPELRV